LKYVSIPAKKCLAHHENSSLPVALGLKEYAPANFYLILLPCTSKIRARTIHAEDAHMSEEYGSDFISITDEDGKEYELEVLAELEYEGSKYLALVPADDDGSEEDLEVSILKAVEENGEEILVTIDDDDELEAVYSALMDLMYEDEDEGEETESEE